MRSFTATNSRSDPAACAARKRLRPIRPKPFMPTLIPIPLLGYPCEARGWIIPAAPSTELVVGDAYFDRVSVGIREARGVVSRAVHRRGSWLGLVPRPPCEA